MFLTISFGVLLISLAYIATFLYKERQRINREIRIINEYAWSLRLMIIELQQNVSLSGPVEPAGPVGPIGYTLSTEILSYTGYANYNDDPMTGYGPFDQVEAERLAVTPGPAYFEPNDLDNFDQPRIE
jgi:hypothetical protein